MSHVRAYLAGAGATGALIAGAAVVLLSFAAFVAVKGMPLGGSEGNTGNAYLGAKATGPSAAAAAALAAAPGAVAAAPVPGAHAGAALAGGGPGGALPPGSSGTPPGTVGPTSPGTSPTGPLTPTPQQSPGATTNAVNQLDQTLCAQGLCTGASNRTGSVTKPLDDTTRQTLNQVGGAAGDPGLGDQVNHTANNAVNGLLGGGR